MNVVPGTGTAGGHGPLAEPRPDRSSAHRMLRLAAWVAPTLVVLQPLIGGFAASSILFARMLLLPIGVAALMRRAVHGPTLLLLLALVVATGFPGMAYRSQDYFIVVTAILGAVVLYRAGVIVASRDGGQASWVSLVQGISLLNAVTLGVLGAATLGLIDLATLFEPLQRDLDFGLARFSLGNPIEVPFVASAVLYAALRHAPADQGHLGAALLNLTSAAISESRVVVLIALLIFAEQWLRSRPGAKLVSTAALLGLLAWSGELLMPLVESISARFAGQDFGSGEDRAFLVDAVLHGIDPLTLWAGNGLTSGAELIRQVAGTYRTVESALLQMVYEIGVVGLAIVVAALRVGLPPHRPASPWMHPVTFLLWVQLLLFLPVSNLIPMAAFALGALAVAAPSHRR